MTEFDTKAVDLSGILNKGAEEKAKQVPDPSTYHLLCVLPDIEEEARHAVGESEVVEPAKEAVDREHQGQQPEIGHRQVEGVDRDEHDAQDGYRHVPHAVHEGMANHVPQGPLTASRRPHRRADPSPHARDSYISPALAISRARSARCETTRVL